MVDEKRRVGLKKDLSEGNGCVRICLFFKAPYPHSPSAPPRVSVSESESESNSEEEQNRTEQNTGRFNQTDALLGLKGGVCGVKICRLPKHFSSLPFKSMFL